MRARDLVHLALEADAALLASLAFGSGDRREGIWKKRLPFGPLIAQTHYRAGRRHGTRTCWYLDGKKRREVEYADGVKHGRATAWYRKGNKRYVGHFVHGSQTGEWFYFRPDGKLDGVRTGMYEDGLRYAAMKGFNDWNA
jgi:antitoxin component YwqK of YwqJK toxin-antitoxin module